MKTTNNNKLSAFTFVEVMIVVMILAIASAIGIPMLSDTSESELSEAAKLLSADILFAQNESITHGNDLRVLRLNQGSSTYWIATQSNTEIPITDKAQGGPYRVTFGQGRANALNDITIQSASFANETLTFGLYGQLVVGKDQTITLSKGTKRVRLTIAANTGEVTIGDIYNMP